MRRTNQLALGAIALVIVAISALALVRVRTSAADDGSSAESVRVTRRDIGSVVKATGVIKPRVGAEVKVGSRISGVVKRLYVRIGDSVRHGQMLAELDERDLVARRDEARATLQQAEVALRYARIDLDRKRALLPSGGVMATDIEG